MKIRKIIDLLNDSILNRRKREGIKDKSFLILCDSENKIPNSDYIRFKSILWLISSKDQQKVITVENTIKVTNSVDLITARQISASEVMSKLFDLMNGDSYEYIISGKFKARKR